MSKLKPCWDIFFGCFGVWTITCIWNEGSGWTEPLLIIIYIMTCLIELLLRSDVLLWNIISHLLILSLVLPSFSAEQFYYCVMQINYKSASIIIKLVLVWSQRLIATCICCSGFKSINSDVGIASTWDVTDRPYLWHETQKQHKNQVSFLYAQPKKKSFAWSHLTEWHK